MPKKSNQLKTTSELTQQQRKFVDILVVNWGNIKKVDAAEQAGYKSTKGKVLCIIANCLFASLPNS